MDTVFNVNKQMLFMLTELGLSVVHVEVEHLFGLSCKLKTLSNVLEAQILNYLFKSFFKKTLV